MLIQIWGAFFFSWCPFSDLTRSLILEKKLVFFCLNLIRSLFLFLSSPIIFVHIKLCFKVTDAAKYNMFHFDIKRCSKHLSKCYVLVCFTSYTTHRKTEVYSLTAEDCVHTDILSWTWVKHKEIYRTWKILKNTLNTVVYYSLRVKFIICLIHLKKKGKIDAERNINTTVIHTI